MRKHKFFRHFAERGFGRLLGHGDLRYVILFLLEEKPRHGYELIKALEELSSGVYSPSPGAIYPTLTFLEDSGLATVSTEENKKLYTITAEGKARLDKNRESLNLLIQRFSSGGEKMSRFKEFMGQTEAAEARSKDHSSIRGSMHGLKVELFRFLDAPGEKKEKVAAILENAIKEIQKIK